MSRCTTPSLSLEEDLHQQKIEMVWEVLARVGADPAGAAWYMAEHQRLAFTQAEARQQLDAAKQRNRLKLVNPDCIRSSFGRRLRPH